MNVAQNFLGGLGGTVITLDYEGKEWGLPLLLKQEETIFLTTTVVLCLPPLPQFTKYLIKSGE